MSSAVHLADRPLHRAERRERRLLTPEGVPLRIELAEPGERLLAFLVDLTISDVSALLLAFAFELIPRFGVLKFTLPVTLFLMFLVRNAYFIYFELRWAGTTPGKHMLGLRVIDRRGGPLLPGAVIARNLTRQAEFFFPVELLLVTHGWLWSAMDVLPASLWLAAMFGLMLGSRDRQRGGDLIAGTVVISVPKRILLEDLAEEEAPVRFTDAQLQTYGVLELQVLEEILRRPLNEETNQVMREVRDRIQKRIGWDRNLPTEEAARFLRDFYTAQRAFLEHRKNMGEERPDKFHEA